MLELKSILYHLYFLTKKIMKNEVLSFYSAKVHYDNQRTKMVLILIFSFSLALNLLLSPSQEIKEKFLSSRGQRI